MTIYVKVKRFWCFLRKLKKGEWKLVPNWILRHVHKKDFSFFFAVSSAFGFKVFKKCYYDLNIFFIYTYGDRKVPKGILRWKRRKKTKIRFLWTCLRITFCNYPRVTLTKLSKSLHPNCTYVHDHARSWSCEFMTMYVHEHGRSWLWAFMTMCVHEYVGQVHDHVCLLRGENGF